MSADVPRIAGYSGGRLLGQGGYAVVYLFHDEERGEDVAVKVLQLLDASARSQFADEIRVLSSFGEDPRIVPYLGQGTLDGDQPYFVMRYCAGGSLSKWVGTHGLPIRDVVQTGLRIGRALDAVHRRHWLHRDIKPSNILVDEAGGAPRLSDFGIATPSRNGEAGPGDPAVSVAWSAPEVILKSSRGSVASDVYSLGATLWHLLTGHAPYEIPGGDNSAEALERRVVGSRLAGLGRDGVPTALEHLLRSMLEKDPVARPPEVADVIRVLELIDGQLQAPAAPQPQPMPLPEPGLALAPIPVPHEDVPEIGFHVAPPRTTKRRVLIFAGVGVVLVGALVAVAGLSGGSASAGAGASHTGSPVASGPGAQDAGVLGDPVPPGMPDVTARRVDASTVKFTWTYAASQETDTFAWRIVGGTRSGVSGTASIELSDPAGQRLCIQVRVLRAGVGDPGSPWSAADCGS